MKKSETLLDLFLRTLANYLRISVLWIRKYLSGNEGRRIFIFAFAIFFVAKVFLVALPELTRVAPVEADDGYSYAVRASQITGCQNADCPALVSLKSQILRTSAEPEHNLILGGLYNRIFVFTQPLYFAILAFINSLGLSWEVSISIVSILGIVFIAAAIGYWLHHFFGATTAGIALLLLAFQTFNFQGLNHIIGSNITLAFALITWAQIFKGIQKASLWLPLALILMLAMHNIGLAYAFVALLLLLLSSPRPFNRETKVNIGSVLLVITGYFLLRALVVWPELSLQTSTYFSNPNYLGSLNRSIPFILALIRTWLFSLWSAQNALLLLAIGLISLNHIRRKSIILMLTLLVSLALGGIFFPLPLNSIEIFPRVWVPLVIFLMAIIAAGLNNMADTVFTWIDRPAEKNSSLLSSTTALFTPRGWNLLFTILIATATVFSIANLFKFQARHYKLTLENRMLDSSLAFDPAQPDYLLSNIRPNEAVVYMDTVAMEFFLVNGAMAHPAVLYKAIRDVPSLELWLEENQTVAYLVARNPSHVLQSIQDSAIRVDPRSAIKLLGSPNIFSSAISLDLQNQDAKEIIIQLSYISKGLTTENTLILPPNSSGWINLADHLNGFPQELDELTLKSNNSFFLRGIRLHQDQLLNWPWDMGTQLIYIGQEVEDPEPTVIEFTTDSLSKDLNLSIQVIDDSGTSILARIID